MSHSLHCASTNKMGLSGITLQKSRAPAATLTPDPNNPPDPRPDLPRRGDSTRALHNMTAWHGQSLSLRRQGKWVKKKNKKIILSVKPLKKSSKKRLPRKVARIKPKQRGASCFSRAHSSQNSPSMAGGGLLSLLSQAAL